MISRNVLEALRFLQGHRIGLPLAENMWLVTKDLSQDEKYQFGILLSLALAPGNSIFSDIETKLKEPEK